MSFETSRAHPLWLHKLELGFLGSTKLLMDRQGAHNFTVTQKFQESQHAS